MHRLMTRDAVRLGQGIPHIHALVELDITRLRLELKSYRKAHGDGPGLTSVLLNCCAAAIDEHAHLQRYLDFFGRERAVRGVDIFFPVENRFNDQPILLAALIRNAENLSVQQMDAALGKAVDEKIKKLQAVQRFFLRAPWIIKKIFYRFWMGMPRFRRDIFGTVYISSIMNYSANRRTWGIPQPMHSLGIFIGTASKRMIKTSAGMEERDMLQITVSVDHRISNGGEMARFVHCLKNKLEDGKYNFS